LLCKPVCVADHTANKTTKEIRKMVGTTLMGYGQVLARRYERKGKLEAARNALKEGLSVEQAARITGIPVDKLKKPLAAGSNKRSAVAS
jgi:predicted transposase YdaD